MEVKWLERDEWDGVRDARRTIEDPTLAGIEAAIQALDQKRHTLIRLILADGAYMAIGGGRGDYVVYVTSRDQRSVTLNTERFTFRSDPPVRIVVGGQEGEYESRYVATLGEVISAALGFAFVGGLESRHSWTPR